MKMLPCGHPENASGPGGCRVCAVLARRAAKKAALPPPAPPPAPRPARVALEDRYTCVNRLGPTGEKALCLECGKKGQEFETLGCALPQHGRCHPLRRLKGVTRCSNCPDRVPLPGMPDAFRKPAPAPTPPAG
jgi:hypothetical protein